MFEHAVEDAEQLPNAGGKGQFLGLTSGTETLVEGLDNRVVPGRDQRPHVQRGPHPSSSTPHCALSSEGTAVSVERSNTHEAGDPPAVQRTQFRQLSQQGQRQYLTNTWDATQQIVLLAPQGTLPERVSQVGIQLGHVLLQPSYVALDLPSHRARSRMEPVLLRSNHRYQLPPPSQQCRQGLSLGVRQRPRRRFHCFSESGENTRIQPVSLGQLAGCTREVSNLAWIDHHHRQLRRCQRSRQRKLQSSRRLKDHQGRSRLLKPSHQVTDSLLFVGYAPLLLTRPYRYVQPLFSHIDPQCRDSQTSSRAALLSGPSLRDTGSFGPDNCSGSTWSRGGDPCFATVIKDQESVGLPPLHENNTFPNTANTKM